MARFNSKAEPKKPTETNEMGEQAFLLQPKEELVSTVMTTFLQNSYYENENETVNRIIDKLGKVDPLFAAKLAVYARNEGKLRSVTHLISAAIAKDVSGTDWGKRFYEKIVVRPDDMSEILSAYASLNKMDLKEIKKIPNSIKKGFKAALERLDAYQIDKYKMKRRNVTLIDLVRLFHPKATQKNMEAYKRLIEGKPLEGLYESKILEKEMTKAGQVTASSSEEDKQAAKEEAITAVLENVKGMPIMNLVRNLRNILLNAPDKVNDACGQLRIENKVINSRLLPFRFATAYEEIEKLEYKEAEPTSSIMFESDMKNVGVGKEKFTELKNEILDALEDALEVSCKNIPTLRGTCAILCDDSGSMRSDKGGSSRVSAFSKTNTSTIGHVFASMVAYKQEDVYIGLFGDDLISVPFDRSKRLLDFTRDLDAIGKDCGPATENGIYTFMRNVVEEKKKIDNVIVFSDCQIGGGSFTPWYGTSYNDKGPHFHELFKEFRKINPNANFIVVNVRQYGSTSVFDKTQRILNVAGWSEKIFDVITSNCKGWDAIIKEVEKIEI